MYTGSGLKNKDFMQGLLHEQNCIDGKVSPFRTG
jgi:hypothetical protein